MKVGKMLKEKYGFDNEEVVKMFCDQYGYSQKFVKDMLEDTWGELLVCHIEDIQNFTKIDQEIIDGWLGNWSWGKTIAPMGKCCPVEGAPLVKVDVNLGNLEPKLFIHRTDHGNYIRAGFFPNPGEEEFIADESIHSPELLDNMGMLKATGICKVVLQKKVDVPAIVKEELEKANERIKDRVGTWKGDVNCTVDIIGERGTVTEELFEVKHDSDIAVPMSKNTHDLDPEDVNRIYPQRTVNLLEGEAIQPIPLLETIPKLSDLVSPDWENIKERPEVIPDPGPDYIVVPVELFERMADACSDGGFCVPATRAYDLLEKHEEKYGE